MKPVYNKLYTEAGERLLNDPAAIPWDEYPRPHMRRDEWMNLNGVWELETGGGYMGGVRVPFCVESLLSGVGAGELFRRISYGEKLIYRRKFSVPENWRGKRVILNLGAASRETRVFVNGTPAGSGDSAYFPLSCDITEALAEGENDLTIECVNDLDPAFPYGKQRIRRGGMWYTPCSGIWQTVWLEPVPEKHIWEVGTAQEGNAQIISVKGMTEGVVTCEGREFRLSRGVCRVSLSEPRLWSPEEPNLYEFTVKAGEDEVRGYFAFRTIEIKTICGLPRLCLNGKPYFFHGLLDQGYFSDGLWTPAEPGEYERDILKLKSLGFNMVRKHIKIEPELFYYYCDRLGMAVFQDMVNNGKYRFLRDTLLPTLGITRLGDRRYPHDANTAVQFFVHMTDTVRTLGRHPSVVYWTVFNEGWGQFRADEAYERLRALDATRPIDTTSGWFHRNRSDVDSLHIYFKKLRLGKPSGKPQVISEFGGYVWKDEAHSFNPVKTYGYRIFGTRKEFVSGLRRLYLDELLPLVSRGLCAAVYTQVSDVEDETNGMLTFDRRVMKLAPDEFADVSDAIKQAAEQYEN